MAAFTASIAILLALAALGWDTRIALFRQGSTQARPSLRASGQHAMGITDQARSEALFVFVPELLPPMLMLSLMISVSLLGIIASAISFQPMILVVVPLSILGVRSAALAGATWWYSRRMREQLLPAIQSLAGLMEGGRTMLVAAFASVTPTLPEPLRSEWHWVLEHLNLPYAVTRPDRKTERYTSTHAYVLERLAAQTPVRLHAQVLDQLVAIYEHQLEAQAHQRLTQIAAALARHASLQRSVNTLLGRIRGEAYVISGAFAGILAWLIWSQPERVWAAFVGSEWGLLAAFWFGFWLVLPIVISLIVVRIPDLPL